MGKTGLPIKAQKMIYKELVQAVILYGSERWVVTDAMMTVLEGFHHRISGRIERMTSGRDDDGEWEWHLVNMALEVTGIWPIREYVQRRHEKIAEYNIGRPM